MNIDILNTKRLQYITDPIDRAIANGPWSDLYTAAPGYDEKQQQPLLVDLMEVLRDVSAILNESETHTDER